MDKNEDTILEPAGETNSANRQVMRTAWIAFAIAAAYLAGIGSGYFQWGRGEAAEWKERRDLAKLQEQVNPAEGYALSVPYGDLGPQLVEAGVIDYDAFVQVMSNGGDALGDSQMNVLKIGSDEEIVITKGNARFLLNFFWAVGLANRNPVLTEGPMVEYSDGQIERFASTGGWTLAAKPIAELYASMDLIPLTAEQQALVEEVAVAIYRPCCNNHTLFPDCNHGMAMLGLLELMASRGATADEMFEAAKYVNAFWFPQQNLETALYLQAEQNMDFKDAEPRLVTGAQFSSSSGSAAVRQRLQAGGLLPQAPGQGGSCAN